jgi:hypothetical protein
MMIKTNPQTNVHDNLDILIELLFCPLQIWMIEEQFPLFINHLCSG